jgi:hypothetical protein
MLINNKWPSEKIQVAIILWVIPIYIPAFLRGAQIDRATKFLMTLCVDTLVI